MSSPGVRSQARPPTTTMAAGPTATPVAMAGTSSVWARTAPLQSPVSGPGGAAETGLVPSRSAITVGTISQRLMSDDPP